MPDYQSVYCLFCRTGREEYVVRYLHELGYGRAIFPQRIKTMMVNREWMEVPTPLLPGYIFLYMDDETPRRDELLKVQSVIRVLNYSACGQESLSERDLEFADWIWRQGGRIGAMKALQIGDRVEITDPLFRELHGTVKRMDRRRHTVQVELDAKGSIREVWLTYEVVERQDDDAAGSRED